MSLRSKLTVGMIFICMALIILALTGYVSLNNVVKEYEKLATQSVPKLGDISGMRARAAQLRADSLKLTLFSGSAKEEKEATEGLTKSINRYKEISEEYKSKSFFSKEEEEKFNLVANEAEKILSTGQKILDLGKGVEADKVEKMKKLLIAVEPIALAHQKLLLSLDDHIVDSSASWSKQSNELASKSKTLMTVIAIITIIISAVGVTIFASCFQKEVGVNKVLEKTLDG
ncbi:MAG: MCP four helix bundle domain-containing protein, partial [Bdellovibrionales bacterium]|nr:MCP four helix bundle domain-containing protein [Bdellovibrionales bacterium]